MRNTGTQRQTDRQSGRQADKQNIKINNNNNNTERETDTIGTKQRSDFNAREQNGRAQRNKITEGRGFGRRREEEGKEKENRKRKKRRNRRDEGETQPNESLLALSGIWRLARCPRPRR